LLVLTRRVDESIMIGDEIRVTVVAVKGDHVRVGVDAPKSVSIHRLEVYEEICRSNREASAVAAVPVSLAQLAGLLPSGPSQQRVTLAGARGGGETKQSRP
jgi:carbon storage regulator